MGTAQSPVQFIDCFIFYNLHYIKEPGLIAQLIFQLLSVLQYMYIKHLQECVV